jgi:hypothetical protein
MHEAYVRDYACAGDRGCNDVAAVAGAHGDAKHAATNDNNCATHVGTNNEHNNDDGDNSCRDNSCSYTAANDNNQHGHSNIHDVVGVGDDDRSSA